MRTADSTLEVPIGHVGHGSCCGGRHQMFPGEPSPSPSGPSAAAGAAEPPPLPSAPMTWLTAAPAQIRLAGVEVLPIDVRVLHDAAQVAGRLTKNRQVSESIDLLQMGQVSYAAHR